LIKENKINSYLLIFLTILLIVFSLLYVFNVIDKIFFMAFVTGYLLNLVNTFLAMYLFKKAINRENKLFLINVLGGMVGRMFFLLISFIIILKFLIIDKLRFIFTFFILYFFLLVFEIIYYTKVINNKNG